MSSGISGVGGLTPLPRPDGDNLRARRRAGQGIEHADSSSRAPEPASVPEESAGSSALSVLSAQSEPSEALAIAVRSLSTPVTVAAAARRAYGGTSESGSQPQRDAVARSNREAANGGHPAAITNAIEALHRLRSFR